MEQWDLYDENRKPLNKTFYRKDYKELIQGEYHIVVVVWTVNSNKDILLTLRHPEKDKYPNFWEVTSGSVVAGEKSNAGAIRELYEETGIKADEKELFFLGTIKEKTAFIDNYIIRKDYKLSELTMQEGETVDAQWVTLRRLDEMIDLGLIAKPVARRLVPFRKAFEDFIRYS
jgi:8-oxo-dGTP pyrophosphatase MutT (NUDIX family)